MSNDLEYSIFTFKQNGIIDHQKIVKNHKDYLKEIESNPGFEINIKSIYVNEKSNVKKLEH